METRLPGPCLIVLIGPSGSGKSTWASQNFAATEVVSSDELRSRVGAGEDDQAASGPAFEILEQILDHRLGRGLTTVIDTLGMDDVRRASWIERGHQAGLPVYAVLFTTDPSICETRNRFRSRPIPQAVLKRQFSRFKTVCGLVADESFDAVTEEVPLAVVAPQFVDPVVDPEPVVDDRRTGHTFGLSISRFDWGVAPEEMASTLGSIAVRAEAAGFRDLWVMDHFRQIPSIGRHWEDLPESYTTLAYLAGLTSTIRLGTLVTSVTHRNPVHLGKIVATLDVMSRGRANCGLGAGWDQAEHAAYGMTFPTTPERFELLEDTLRLLPLLWGKGAPSFRGNRIDAESLICYPRPVQARIPIMVGGSGEKRTLALVAEFADGCNLFGKPDTVRRKVGILEGHCENVGRDLQEIEVSHLLTIVSAPTREALADRIEELRARNTPPGEFARRNNAGTTGDHVELFTAYHRAGARHSIVSMPDAHLEGSIESFADVIQEMGRS
jgi:F420-dependent oxidoreductase-like protein